MDKKEGRGLEDKEVLARNFDREYLHSISRIGDRLKVLTRDLKNTREDMVRDLTDMEEDVQMLSGAFDSLFRDHLNKVHDINKVHRVEEI